MNHHRQSQAMPITLDTLRNFCAPEIDPRQWMHQPHQIGPFAYATDGAIAIRVSASARWRAIEDHCASLPQLVALFDRWFEDEEEPPSRRPLPAAHRSVCQRCGGRGRLNRVTTCPACDGRGWEHAYERLGPTTYSAGYLAMIALLPGAVTIYPRQAPGPASFWFDGGVGLLMPLRPVGT